MCQLSRDCCGPWDKLPGRGTDAWLPIREGSKGTVKVEQFYDNDSDFYSGVEVGPALDCFYSVQAEGVFGGEVIKM